MPAEERDIRCLVETLVVQPHERSWILIKTESDWNLYKKDLRDDFEDGEVEHSVHAPPEYPCLTRPLFVEHGTKVMFFHFFVTQQDAKALSL